ncbi:MAG: discoidin domain-containing protein [Candidatus Berkelbacteria bacterium]|nr:discoidin domain-containing protein [Candidatus Berkelbacteria bacterium]
MKLFSKRLFYGGSVFIVLIILISGFLVYLLEYKQKSLSPAEAASGNKTLDSQPDWQLGSYTDNIDLTTLAGSVKIQNNAEINLLGKTTSSDINNDQAPNVIDNDYDTWWNGYLTYEDQTHWWKIDLGETKNYISTFALWRTASGPITFRLYWSLNDIDYTLILPGPGYVWGPCNLPASCQSVISSPISARYIKIVANREDGVSPMDPQIKEFKLYMSPPATHTSASTQIDGGDNFWLWQTFTPTQTVPANTAVSYRFRSSANGTDWGTWSASQTPTSGNPLDISGLVTSRSGDTKYRYLQVETTLSNTDGASTPTVDAYSVGYHTEVKPNKPVAQTAVIQ